MESDEDAPEIVHQLVYASAATRPIDAEELEALLSRARRKNKLAEITGMLLYHEGSFLQALEGDETVVEALYEHIEGDDRHTDATVLFRGKVEGRSFDHWSMGFFRPVGLSGKMPKGMSDFLRTGFRKNRMDDHPDKARELLLAFREGRFRRQVQH